MSFSEFFRAFARIGLLSFGGPAAQIALMHRELVDERKWLTEAEFLRALSFCMMLPGPEAMQLATYAGWKLRGVVGGIIAGLLFVLPGAAVIAALALLYLSFGDQPLVRAAFVGVKAAVIAIVLEALLRISKRALKGRLHTVLEKLLEEVSFTATDRAGETVTVDGEMVRTRVGELAKNADLSKFIL